MLLRRQIGKLATIFKSKYCYQIMPPEDYLINQRDSRLAKTPQTKLLYVLDDSNQGPSNVQDQISLVGVPKGQWKQQFEDYDTLQRNLTRHEPDLIFLEIDPSAYMARQRFASHKCALNKVEQYYVDGVQKIDPHKPITWQQTVVNLLTLDMIRENKIPNDINYRAGFYAYSYPYLHENRSKTDMIKLTDQFVQAIGKHVLDNKRSEYNFIDKVLYTSLMSRHKVMLGGMPETLNRMILGNSLSIHEVRDIFRLVILKNRELTIPLTTKQAAQNFLPHIFQTPKDLYMTAMLKEAFQAATQMIAVVGIQHWRPIQNYWVGAPHGINFSQATHIPDRLEGQTDEDLIEKQAIMEVLMDSRVWGRKYISNPFPYLCEDITKVNQKDLSEAKKCFSLHYNKYSLFKEKQRKQLTTQQNLLELQQQTQQQVSSIQSNLNHSMEVKKYRSKFSKRQQDKFMQQQKNS